MPLHCAEGFAGPTPLLGGLGTGAELQYFPELAAFVTTWPDGAISDPCFSLNSGEPFYSVVHAADSGSTGVRDLP